VPRFLPFAALRYADVDRLATRVAPPYDVLSDTDLDHYLALDEDEEPVLGRARLDEDLPGREGDLVEPCGQTGQDPARGGGEERCASQDGHPVDDEERRRLGRLPLGHRSSLAEHARARRDD
jgi:hypothetical protein